MKTNFKRNLKNPPKTLTEFCGVDDAAFGRYLKLEDEKLDKINQRADKRIARKK